MIISTPDDRTREHTRDAAAALFSFVALMATLAVGAVLATRLIFDLLAAAVGLAWGIA